MKLALIAAGAALAFAGSAAAQDHSNHAGHAQQPAPAAAPAPMAHAQFSADTPIVVLVETPDSKAVLDKHLPGIDQHPAYPQFRMMSLAEVQPYSEGAITDEMLAAIDAELKALPHN